MFLQHFSRRTVCWCHKNPPNYRQVKGTISPTFWQQCSIQAQKCPITSLVTGSHYHCLVITWDWNHQLSQGTELLLPPEHQWRSCSSTRHPLQWVNLVSGYLFYFFLKQNQGTKPRAKAAQASWAGDRPAESIWSSFSEITIQMLTNSM